MPPRARALLAGSGALLAGLALGLPAFGQDSPQSLLPPGFGDQPPPAAAPPADAVPGAAGDVPALALTPPDQSALGNGGDVLDNATDALDNDSAANQELPAYAERSIDAVGPLDDANGGLGIDAFGTADGRFLTGLMTRMDAPIASRWAEILLRRALLTRVPTPAGVKPADWIAERAWLLLRLGEADGARMLIQSVDADKYSARLYQVAMQVALATADPAALCPIVDEGAQASDEAAWPLARAICAGLSGEAGTASALIDKVRSEKTARGIDLLLAERMAGAGSNSRRAITIEWAGVDRLTNWRFGMASAVGLTVPDTLYYGVGPQVRAWEARAPMLSATTRLPPSRIAATLGVFSNAALVNLYSQIAAADDPYAVGDTPAGRLRQAYVAADVGDRMSALRTLWGGSEADARERYAGAILTARAAARIAPSADYADDAEGLITAMLSAGLDIQASRWAGVVNGMDAKKGAVAWALLALGAPARVVAVDAARVTAFAERSGDDRARLRGQLLFAGLAGLGRVADADRASLAQSLGVPLGGGNAWAQALDAAVARNEPGTVALIAALGLQREDWSGISPAFLYRAVRALKAVGREPEARMIAAEAVART